MSPSASASLSQVRSGVVLSPSRTQAATPSLRLLDETVYDNTRGLSLPISKARLALPRRLSQPTDAASSIDVSGFVWANVSVWVGASFRILDADPSCGPGRYNLTTLTLALGAPNRGDVAAELQVGLWRNSAGNASQALLLATAVTSSPPIPADESPAYVSLALPRRVFTFVTSGDVPETTYTIAWRPITPRPLLWHFSLLNASTTLSIAQPTGTYGVASGLVVAAGAPSAERFGDYATREDVPVPGSRLGAQKVACGSASNSVSASASPSASVIVGGILGLAGGSSTGGGAGSLPLEAIIGGVLGAVLLALCCVIFALVFVKRRRRHPPKLPITADPPLDTPSADLYRTPTPQGAPSAQYALNPALECGDEYEIAFRGVDGPLVARDASQATPGRSSLSARHWQPRAESSARVLPLPPPPDAPVVWPPSPRLSASGRPSSSGGDFDGGLVELPTLDEAEEEVARLKALREVYMRASALAHSADEKTRSPVPVGANDVSVGQVQRAVIGGYGGVASPPGRTVRLMLAAPVAGASSRQSPRDVVSSSDPPSYQHTDQPENWRTADAPPPEKSRFRAEWVPVLGDGYRLVRVPVEPLQSESVSDKAPSVDESAPSAQSVPLVDAGTPLAPPSEASGRAPVAAGDFMESETGHSVQPAPPEPLERSVDLPSPQHSHQLLSPIEELASASAQPAAALFEEHPLLAPERPSNIGDSAGGEIVGVWNAQSVPLSPAGVVIKRVRSYHALPRHGGPVVGWTGDATAPRQEPSRTRPFESPAAGIISVPVAGGGHKLVRSATLSPSALRAANTGWAEPWRPAPQAGWTEPWRPAPAPEASDTDWGAPHDIEVPEEVWDSTPVVSAAPVLERGLPPVHLSQQPLQRYAPDAPPAHRGAAATAASLHSPIEDAEYDPEPSYASHADSLRHDVARSDRRDRRSERARQRWTDGVADEATHQLDAGAPVDSWEGEGLVRGYERAGGQHVGGRGHSPGYSKRAEANGVVDVGSGGDDDVYAPPATATSPVGSPGAHIRVSRRLKPGVAGGPRASPVSPTSRVKVGGSPSVQRLPAGGSPGRQALRQLPLVEGEPLPPQSALPSWGVSQSPPSRRVVGLPSSSRSGYASGGLLSAPGLPAQRPNLPVSPHATSMVRMSPGGEAASQAAVRVPGQNWRSGDDRDDIDDIVDILHA